MWRNTWTAVLHHAGEHRSQCSLGISARCPLARIRSCGRTSATVRLTLRPSHPPRASSRSGCDEATVCSAASGARGTSGTSHRRRELSRAGPRNTPLDGTRPVLGWLRQRGTFDGCQFQASCSATGPPASAQESSGTCLREATYRQSLLVVGVVLTALRSRGLLNRFPLNPTQSGGGPDCDPEGASCDQNRE